MGGSEQDESSLFLNTHLKSGKEGLNKFIKVNSYVIIRGVVGKWWEVCSTAEGTVGIRQ